MVAEGDRCEFWTGRDRHPCPDSVIVSDLWQNPYARQGCVRPLSLERNNVVLGVDIYRLKHVTVTPRRRSFACPRPPRVGRALRDPLASCPCRRDAPRGQPRDRQCISRRCGTAFLRSRSAQGPHAWYPEERSGGQAAGSSPNRCAGSAGAEGTDSRRPPWAGSRMSESKGRSAMSARAVSG